jgi:phosphoserine phosphatase RsbU/P
MSSGAMGESWAGVERLACFELWGGNGKAAHPIELPGLQGWIYCTPSGHSTGGGDVHYVSVCSKGQVSRIVVADVTGHGESANSVGMRLRRVLQQYTDAWDQSALMRELNEAFGRDSKGVQYATAVVLGFYFGTGELLFTNAGHLPLLWYHAASGVWEWLEERTPYAKAMADLPLGLINGTAYAQTAVELGRGDLLLLYTDGITESCDPSGEQLGQEGLVSLARELPVAPPEGPVEFGRALLAKVRQFRGGGPQMDDETLVVLQRQAGAKPELPA